MKALRQLARKPTHSLLLAVWKRGGWNDLP